MLRTIKSIMAGACCLLLGGFGLRLCFIEPCDEESIDEQLERMPDHDYLAEISGLEASGRLEEAEQLADWVISGSSITNKDAVISVREEINRKRMSIWGRVKRAMKGFAVGEGSSVEEMGGVVVSDFLLWGDIRDLAKQGYYKVKGKETDPVVAALAAVGVGTSVASYWVLDPAEGAEVAADASFSFLKTLRKMGHLSNKFCGILVDACKESVKAKAISKSLKEIAIGTKSLFDNVGAVRAVAVMKHVDDVDSLKTVSKMAKHAAEPTMILVRMNGADGIKALRVLADAENGASMLEKAARKGSRGIRKLLTYAKYGARGTKSLSNLKKFLLKFVQSAGRVPIGLISGAFLLLGAWKFKIWRIIRSIRDLVAMLKGKRLFRLFCKG